MRFFTWLKEMLLGRDEEETEELSRFKVDDSKEALDETVMFFNKVVDETDEGITTFGEKLKKYPHDQE